MATLAGKTHCLLMNVCMAGHAVASCFREYQGFMARPAIQFFVLPLERQIRHIMSKHIGALFKCPAFGVVAIGAGNGKIFAMRTILGDQQVRREHQEGY